MATGKGIFIVGEAELKRKIDKLYSLGSRKSQIRAAFNRASKPLRMKARSNAKQLNKTRRSGKRKEKGAVLWKSIKLITSKRYRGVYWVGPSHGLGKRFDAWYGFFLEAGTRSRVTRGSKRRHRLGITIKKAVSGGISRGRIRPRRFMRRAYLSTRNTVQRNIRKELNLMIKKLVS